MEHYKFPFKNTQKTIRFSERQVLQMFEVMKLLKRMGGWTWQKKIVKFTKASTVLLLEMHINSFVQYRPKVMMFGEGKHTYFPQIRTFKYSSRGEERLKACLKEAVIFRQKMLDLESTSLETEASQQMKEKLSSEPHD